MIWKKESILILAEVAPIWSNKYGSYLVCTGGVSQEDGWRRLYPMPLDSVMGKIHRWDLIDVKTTEPEHDTRVESRKVNSKSIVNHGKAIHNREKQRAFLNNLSESSLDLPIQEGKSISLIKPVIVDFKIEERKHETIQLTLNGRPFKKQPYADVGLFYKWKCPTPCEVCQKHPHNMECFDWGANILWKRYEKNPEEAKEKVTEMCYWNMKEKLDSWFVLGTHSRHPKKWMAVGILWMKKS